MPRPFALTPGSGVALYVVVRQEIADSLVASRFEVATRGTCEADGSLRLDVSRVSLDRSDAKGRVTKLSTDPVAADPASRSAADTATIRFLEALRAASLRIRLDATDGITAVDGLDRALDGVVARDASSAAERAALRDICSDDGWRRGLAAAGLSAPPDGDSAGGGSRRSVRLRVAGLGETTMVLTGSPGADDGGTPAVHFEGALRADAKFDGDAGEAPRTVGAADASAVRGEATTSYPARGGPPSKGEWTLTVPYASGIAVRTTTTFTLVRR